MVTIGIRPTHPETGYGYIQYDADSLPPAEAGGDGRGEALDDDDGPPTAYPVLTFAEKPDLTTAERFLDAGDFLWNSGMFIWRADAILAAFERYLPVVHKLFAPLAETFGTDGKRPKPSPTRTSGAPRSPSTTASWSRPRA